MAELTKVIYWTDHRPFFPLILSRKCAPGQVLIKTVCSPPPTDRTPCGRCTLTLCWANTPTWCATTRPGPRTTTCSSRTSTVMAARCLTSSQRTTGASVTSPSSSWKICCCKSHEDSSTSTPPLWCTWTLSPVSPPWCLLRCCSSCQELRN